MLALFDFPDPNVHAARRTRTAQESVTQPSDVQRNTQRDEQRGSR